MSAAAAAVVGGSVLSAGMGLISSQNAANSQSQAVDRTNQMQMGQFDTQQKNMQPYIQSGQAALGQLNSQMPDLTKKFTMNDFHQDPGYQFQLEQGTNAMQRSAAAKGFLDSSGTMMNLNNYAQGMANTDYQQALNNFTNNQNQRYNMLSGIAGMGNTANGQMAQVGMNTANQMGSNMMAQGNAMAAGQMGQANAIAGGVGGATNGLMNMQMMNRFAPQQQSPSPYGSSGISNSQAVDNLPQLSMPALE